MSKSGNATPAEARFNLVMLGDIAHLEMGQSPDSRFVVEDPFVGYPFLQGNAEFGPIFPEPRYGCWRPAKLCKANDVLISVRAPVGAVNLADRDYCIGRGLAAIRFRGIKPSLAREVIARQASALRRVAQGTTFEAISKGDLLSLALTLPPREDWQQITSILDTLTAAIYETEAIIAKLKAVKQGLLHDLLTRGIDANGELRPPQSEVPHFYKESPLGWIPKEWGLKPLGQILAEPTKNGLYKPSQFHGRGPLMVQMGGLFAGDAATFGTATRVQVTPFEFNTFGLSEGDLLFARRSLVFEGAGQCVIVRNLAEPATFESSIVRVRVRQDVALPEFVCQFLRGHRSNAQRRTLIRQVAVSGVSGADIRELLIALPSVKEQGLVLGRQLGMQARIDLEMASAAKLRSQKAGLMDDLLTGRIRVTQLLERAGQIASA